MTTGRAEKKVPTAAEDQVRGDEVRCGPSAGRDQGGSTIGR